MKKIIRSARSDGNTIMSAVIGYPEFEGCEKINAFYSELASGFADYAVKTAEMKKGTGNPDAKLTVKLTPRLRNLTDTRADVTFDALVSDDGRLIRYFRAAHVWDVTSERLLSGGKMAGKSFPTAQTI